MTYFNEFGQARLGWNVGTPSGGGGGNSIITNGLILNLDAGNSASYPGTGTTWTDLSGQNNNGTLVTGPGNPGPTWSSTNGGTFSFDGVNDYGQVPAFTYPNSYTVAVWVKINYTNSTNYARILEKGLNNEFSLNINKGTSLYANKYTYQLGDSSVALASSTISTGYALLTTTVENTSSNNYTIKFYINSTLDNTTTYTTSFTKNNPLYFGGNPGVLSITAMFGEIGQIFMYNRIISASEVLQNFNATKTRFGL